MSVLWSLVLLFGGAALGALAWFIIRPRRGVSLDAPVRGASEYFERLFEHAPVAVVLSDRAGRILRVNRRFSELFGFARDEVTGLAIDELIVPPELLSEARDTTRIAADGFKEIRSTVRRRKDGT